MPGEQWRPASIRRNGERRQRPRRDPRGSRRTEAHVCGSSYGALIGALYAEHFPTRIRAMILDGPFDPALDTATEGRDRAAALQQQLDLFMAWCASDRTCAFWSDGLTRPAFDALMARFSDAPISGVSAAQAWWSVLVLLPAGTWTELAQALDGAREGNPTVLASIGADVSGLMDANMAVSCIDWPLPRDADWYAKTGLRSAVDGARLRGARCLLGPLVRLLARAVPTRAGASPSGGSPPILILASTGDAATPTAGASRSRTSSPRVYSSRATATATAASDGVTRASTPSPTHTCCAWRCRTGDDMPVAARCWVVDVSCGDPPTIRTT